MILQEFFDKYNGKGVDFDGFYGFQCMDVYQQYNKEVIGAPHIPAHAASVWERYPLDFYNRIENRPDNFPFPGDVIIWNNHVGAGYGHIAICTDANIDKFTSFDQNWPAGSVCHFQDHVYTNVVGWLRPKSSIMDDMPEYLKTLLQENNLTDESKIREFFEKARKYDGLTEDLKNCQQSLSNSQNSSDLSIKDILILLIQKIYK